MCMLNTVMLKFSKCLRKYSKGNRGRPNTTLQSCDYSVPTPFGNEDTFKTRLQQDNGKAAIRFHDMMKADCITVYNFCDAVQQREFKTKGPRDEVKMNGIIVKKKKELRE